MKALFISMLFLFGTSISFSQVNKAEIEGMLSNIGTTFDAMKTITIYNTNTFYTDGTSKKSYDKYSMEKGNVISLGETGILITYIPDGVKTSVQFIPYSSIIEMGIGKTFMSVYLKD